LQQHRLDPTPVTDKQRPVDDQLAHASTEVVIVLALNIIKLCVGADSIADLAAWQETRAAHHKRAGFAPRLVHTTRMVPKRQDEIVGRGSLYWVIKGIVQVRQRIIGFDSGAKQDGTPCCLFVLDPTLVPVRPVVRKAFQGWRYLTTEDAPIDLKGSAGDDMAALPSHMRKELAALGLL
jgi:hypothetical protein